MMLDITSPMNYVINDQFTLKLVGVSLDNTSQILSKSLLSFAKIWKIGHSKIAKI